MTTPATPDLIPGAGQGFSSLCCLSCGKEDSVFLKLHDLSDIYCGECGNSVTLEYVRKTVAGYSMLLKWVAMAPNYAASTGG